jgi:hypothetical protein
MVTNYILYKVLKAMNSGEYLVRDDESDNFYLPSQPYVYLVKNDLIRYKCITEVDSDHYTGFKYYKLSFYGDIQLSQGKMWWRSLPLLEKIKLILLVGF